MARFSYGSERASKLLTSVDVGERQNWQNHLSQITRNIVVCSHS